MTLNELEAVAKMIDHALLHPALTDAELKAGCELALKYNVASVCIKPYAVAMAAEILAGSDVQVCTVVGFPHGSQPPHLKIAEVLQACQDGATEIDMVINIGKVLSEDWEYIAYEVQVVKAACQRGGAILKVIFENDYLPADSYKVRLCQICTKAGVAFVKTSTGFGFVKGADGCYDYKGATEHDLWLMLANIGANVEVKASGGIRTLDEALRIQQMGVKRIGTSSTASIMEEAYRRIS
ncbi:deoxyribose-phosphate aldolase [Arsenicibacter rosenii]|uniref:Deoxyribose-phosphate aldolase n=1 Tax=Arsenicibacter rosenii TaxID=1750698 RepID=A0A1S2VJP7_9BACT|nr:deoxyribose-phosphate aldolase [Arsenicibacter rosenii]OIN58610.1 deoxyribose-phosphate aldolase [Arsenicibacter rosenii]